MTDYDVLVIGPADWGECAQSLPLIHDPYRADRDDGDQPCAFGAGEEFVGAGG